MSVLESKADAKGSVSGWTQIRNPQMKNYLCALTIFICHLPLQAEVITDGTLGAATSLPGPEYLIKYSLGQQLGKNLFHSFKTFNINTGESATFTGPNSVANILTRVTGSNSSFIDGTIRSKIPNANLYLLNPKGILFGKNASLEISGSFHASTADYLRLGNNGKFFASHPDKSLLTVAPPQAFGFLDNPATITIQDSRLFVPPEQTLSIIGGDIYIDDATLAAESGRINLAAVATEGEVIFTDSDLTMSGFSQPGIINISQSSTDKRFIEFTGKSFADFMKSDPALPPPPGNIDVSGASSGQVFIRAGQFFLDKGSIFADTYQNKGLGIDIEIAGDMQLTNGAKITADNYGNSEGGHISIITKNLSLNGYNDEMKDYKPLDLSGIAASNFSPKSGIGGDININTTSLEIAPGTINTAANFGIAGNITINAKDTISLLYKSNISASTITCLEGIGCPSGNAG
jgi:filamentous hemagglutinin family protein